MAIFILLIKIVSALNAFYGIGLEKPDNKNDAVLLASCSFNLRINQKCIRSNAGSVMQLIGSFNNSFYCDRKVCCASIP